MNRKKFLDNTFETIIKVMLLLASLSLVMIFGFLLFGAIPFFKAPEASTFFTHLQWNPKGKEFGILGMLIGTFLTTFGALTIAIPISIFASIYIAEYAPPKLANLVYSATRVLSMIPSIIIGFLGLVIIIPIIRSFSGGNYVGESMLAGVIVLSVMVMPIMIGVTVSAIKNVPYSYKEASYGLGANKIQTIFKILIPAARNGIYAGGILAFSKAIGEATAMLMVIGTTSQLDFSNFSVLNPTNTLTTTIAKNISEAPAGVEQDALFAIAFVLLIITLVTNIIINIITKRGNHGK
jgi:phosphate transport system permease protein